jgi:NADPH:quinone reductase-like Zn-dependent oxidoreductase
MDTMMALRAHRRGGPETLGYETAPRPTPADGEVLIQVAAAAITFAELTWDETWTRNGVDRTPIIPSHEMSGVISELGATVTDLEVGSEVYGLIPFDRDGAAAEFVAVPADVLARKPVTVDHVRAAATPLAALTAWQALVDHARCRTGESVLVHGGAGGVGGFVVQLASRLGAHVVATARAQDADTVRGYGANGVIDFENELFDVAPGVYDIVIDTVGGTTLDRSFAVLRPRGRLITLQAPPSQERAAELGITATFFIVKPDRSQLAAIADLIDKGQLQVAIAETFPLASGRQAFLSAAQPHRSPGKTVLIVRQ